MTYSYGWRPSLPDHRDLLADLSGVSVAPEVDPRNSYMTPVYDQGQLGSCTANAVAAALDADIIVHGGEPVGPARLGIYYGERKLEGAPLDRDTGAFGRDGLKAAQQFGVWKESRWAYSDSVASPNFSTDPAQALGAPDYRLTRKYRAVPKTVTALKAALSAGQTVAFGFTVYESFESEAVARSGLVPLPAADEKTLGGHEVLLVGYLKSEPHYGLVRNSWGAGWGIAGYCLFPWAYLTGSLAGDHRTITR